MKLKRISLFGITISRPMVFGKNFFINFNNDINNIIYSKIEYKNSFDVINEILHGVLNSFKSIKKETNILSSFICYYLNNENEIVFYITNNKSYNSKLVYRFNLLNFEFEVCVICSNYNYIIFNSVIDNYADIIYIFNCFGKSFLLKYFNYLTKGVYYGI